MVGSVVASFTPPRLHHSGGAFSGVGVTFGQAQRITGSGGAVFMVGSASSSFTPLHLP